MEAVCILLGVKPEASSAGPDYWKLTLGDVRFLDRLCYFDKDNIDPKALETIRKDFIPNPCFHPDAIGKCSKAARSLCVWVHAMDTYARVSSELAPARAKIHEVDAVLEEARILLPPLLAATVAEARSATANAAAALTDGDETRSVCSELSDWSHLSEWSHLSRDSAWLQGGMGGMGGEGGEGGEDDAMDDACSVASDWTAASQEAFNELDLLSKADITELKALAKPPALVKVVLEAVCVTLGKKRVGWTELKKMLAQCWAGGLLPEVRAFDPDSVSSRTLRLLRVYVHHPGMHVDAVSNVSKACVGLCLWVHAVYSYRKATIGARRASPSSAPLQALDEDAELAEEGEPVKGSAGPTEGDDHVSSRVDFGSLRELRALSKPPAGVDDVTGAVLILLGYEDTSWKAAKKALASPRAFVDAMRYFDPASADGLARIERARGLLQREHMSVGVMRKKSTAAGRLLVWARAVVDGRCKFEQPVQAAAPTSKRSALDLTRLHLGAEGKADEEPSCPSPESVIDAAALTVDETSRSDILRAVEINLVKVKPLPKPSAARRLV